MKKLKLNIQLFGAVGSISCSQVGDYDIANNTTVERITFTVTRSGGTTYWEQKRTVNFTVDGNAYTSSVSLPSNKTSNSCYVDVTVQHDTDGSKTLYYSASIATGTSAGTVTASGSKQLTTIPRASTFTLTPSSSFTIGDNVTLNINKASPNFTHTIFAQAPSMGNTWWKLIEKTSSSSVTITTSDISVSSWLQAIPNADSATVSFAIDTYNGDTYLGVYRQSITAYVPSSAKPSASLTISEANTAVSSKGWGIYIQNLSRLNVSVTASGYEGSTITSTSTRISDNITSTNTSFQSNTLTTSGTTSIITTVTDSRARTGTAMQGITVYAYSSPTITKGEAVRCDSSGNPTDSGNYLKYTFVGSISPINNNNSKLFRIGYKTSSQSSYTYVTISNSSYSINSTAVLSGVTFSTSTSYDIVLEAVDSFNTTSISATLVTDSDLINFNASGKSIAFGKVSEASSNEKLMEVALDTKFTGNISFLNVAKYAFLDMIYPVGSVYISVNSTNPSTLFGGVWERIAEGRCLMGQGEVKENTDNRFGMTYEGDWTASNGSMGGEIYHQLTVSEMPSHLHDEYIDEGGNKRPYCLADGGGNGTTTSGGVFFGGSRSSYNGPNVGTAPIGGDQAHNNMPPYLVVYMWKRISDAPTITVTTTYPSGSSNYGFALSGGYYESQNKGVDNSYAMCRVKVVATRPSTVTFSYINYAESDYDYGLFSNIDTQLTSSSTADTTGVYKSCKGESSSTLKTLTYTVTSGTHYIYVKFIKDNSQSSNNDSIKFQVTGS